MRRQIHDADAAQRLAIEMQPPAALPMKGELAAHLLSSPPTSANAPTADAENVEFVGHIGGDTHAVAVQRDYAYIGEGGALTILDVSNPAAPSVMGKTVPFPEVVQDVYVSGDYAYVAAGEGGLRVVDVSTPTNPTEVGCYDTPGYANSVAVSGSYAYVADWYAGLRVVDVSDPAHPTEVGSYDTPGSARGVVVSGGYAYVGGCGMAPDYDGWLQVVDVSDPVHPTEIGACDTPGYAQDVAVAGGYAYVADGSAGLRVVDVSDPARPTEIGFYDTPGSASGVYVSGDIAYVVGYDGLWVVDVSDPSHPTELGSYDTPGSASGVYVSGDYAYVADSWGGLRVVDVSDPVHPTEIGYYDTPGWVWDVYVSGDYAYVTGLLVLDVSDPAHPTEVGHYDTSGSVMAVAGDYAYVADWDYGLRVLDVSDPAHPTEVGSYNTPGDTKGVAAAGGYAYVADGSAGLRVVDVSDPSHPTEIGACDTPGFARGVAVSGDYAYVADSWEGLRVVDVSTPSNPTEVGFCDTPGYAYARGVTVAGGYVYVADGIVGLRVVDISDPAHPTEVGSYDTERDTWDIALAGDYVYVVESYEFCGCDGWLRVVDVSDPAHPIEVGFYDTPGSARGVSVSEGYVYVADDYGGLIILRYTGGAEVTPAPVSLALALEDWIHPTTNLQVGLWLHSESPEPIPYTVRVTLSQEGQALDVLENPLTASVNNAPYLSFDFGMRDAGPYEVLVEALLDDTVLASMTGHTEVLSSTDAAQALTAAAELTRAAHWEFSEGQESVVWAYGESVPGLVAEAIDFLLGKLLGLIPWVGDAVGASAEELTEALYEITSKLQGLEELIEATSRPDVEYRARQATDTHLSFERRDVDTNHQQYNDFVMSHTIVWDSDHARLTGEYWEIISTRVEEERSLGPAAPASLFQQLSLKERETVLLIYKGIGAIFSTLAVLACLAVMFVVIVKALAVTWGTAMPVIIKNLVALKPMLSGLRSITAILLVLLAIEMDLQLDLTVAPAIRDRHQEALTELRSLDLYSGQQSEIEPGLQVQIAGNTVTLSTFPADEIPPTDTRLRTKFYSADGRLLEVQTCPPAMTSCAPAMTLQLPAGTYRAVTSAPVIGDLGSDAQVRVFEVAGPQVALDLALVTSQLGISETLQANIWVTNTDTLTGTGSLALVVEASDGENGDAWVVELDPEGRQQFDLSFIPPEAGSYILRARLFGPDGTLLALREAGYVVGAGPALALEPVCQDVWQPGEMVTAHITATNSGNEVAHGLLDVVTWDQESQCPIYTTTLSLNLTAGASEIYTVTALTEGQPGRYSVNLLLDGEGYLSFPFVVAAENTLLVVAEATPQYGAIGQPVETAIEVVDMTYTSTNATVTAYVVDPLFTSHSISVSHTGEGLYATSYTPTLSGTYEIFVTAARENWRGDSTSATFVAQQASCLASTVTGNPQVGQLRTVTVTVNNEFNLPVVDALVTISGTQEYVNRTTDTSGLALFPLLASSGIPYKVRIEKPGHATTYFDLAIEPAKVYLPLVLRN